MLTAVLRDARSPEPVRDAALEAVEMIGSKKAVDGLIDLMGQKTLSAARRPRVIKALGRFKDAAAIKPLWKRSRAPAAAVRAAAVDALVAIVKDKKVPAADDVATGVRALLTDPAPEVRNRAIAAAGAIGDRQAVPALIELADKPDRGFEAGLALAELSDMRALQVYLHGLTSKNNELRKASAAAIAKMRDPAAVLLEQLAKRNELSPAVLPELRSIFAGHGAHFHLEGARTVPHRGRTESCRRKPVDLSASFEGVGGKRVTWKDRESGRRMTARSTWDGILPTTTTCPPMATPRSRARRAEGADGRRLGRHSDDLVQRQAGLRLCRPPWFFRRRGTFRGDVASRRQPHS